MSEEKRPEGPATPVLKILSQIRSGEINLEEKELPKDIRVECVDYLWMTEVQPIATMASILNVSEKTIRRDQEEINIRNSKKLSTEDAVNLVGELISKLSSTHENLMRLARDKTATVQEKAQAGMYAYKAIEGQIALLQKLGFAPSKPMQIEADVHHHQDDDVTVDQVKTDLAEIEALAEAKGRKDPDTMKLIETAKQQLALAEAKNTVAELRNNLNKPQGNTGEQGK